jgi:hypothetical protein
MTCILVFGFHFCHIVSGQVNNAHYTRVEAESKVTFVTMQCKLSNTIEYANAHAREYTLTSFKWSRSFSPRSMVVIASVSVSIIFGESILKDRA